MYVFLVSIPFIWYTYDIFSRAGCWEINRWKMWLCEVSLKIQVGWPSSVYISIIMRSIFTKKICTYSMIKNLFCDIYIINVLSLFVEKKWDGEWGCQIFRLRTIYYFLYLLYEWLKFLHLFSISRMYSDSLKTEIKSWRNGTKYFCLHKGL